MYSLKQELVPESGASASLFIETGGEYNASGFFLSLFRKGKLNTPVLEARDLFSAWWFLCIPLPGLNLHVCPGLWPHSFSSGS